jgi:hypothetical protein
MAGDPRSPSGGHEAALLVHAGAHRGQDVVEQTLGLAQEITVRNAVVQDREDTAGSCSLATSTLYCPTLPWSR